MIAGGSRAPQTAARDESVDIHLELQRLRVDEGERWKRIRGSRSAAPQERAARFNDDVGRRWSELGPDGNARYFGDCLRHD